MMKWRSWRRSSNVQDRRGVGMLAGGGIGTVLLVAVAILFGINPGDLLQQAPGPSAGGASVSQDSLADFSAAVLASTEDVWSTRFREAQQDYPEPQLVLFSGAVQSACGFAQAAMGPFYCSRDQSVYIDLSFFHDLRDRFGAAGDFAQAYVVAHEVGHHVQNVLGLLSTGGGNEASVRQELQADCLAGIWGYYAREQQQLVEPGDMQEALNAASAIGDDRLQQQSQGYVVPESFTHGSSAQRMEWFRRGYDSGDIQRCST